MLSDGDASFTKALDWKWIPPGSVAFVRNDTAMVIENGIVKQLNIEAPNQFEVSSAEAILASL